MKKMKEKIEFVYKRIIELKKEAFSIVVKGIYDKILRYLTKMMKEIDEVNKNERNSRT
jgi:predicted AlkP superfamily phosphohydrolase/phosphomutase